MYEQLNIFDLTLPKFEIDKPIRLIELFAGIGSQAMAIRDLGVEFEHYRVVEFDKYAIKSYNAIHGTDFPTMDIRQVSGADLGISDTDKYCYIMTYSFPCQDLSVAGKQKGMAKGSGTRSGLLWEVERLLNEVDNLPQVLLMENVPQVHSDDNMADFRKWIDFLESKGYSNYWQDLNAKDYGVAQNRERCFMVSILGESNYKFPQPKQLNKTMKDYLEDNVEEKYYINTERAQKLIDALVKNKNFCGCIGNINPSEKGINGNVYAGKISPTITTNKGEGAKICVDLSIKQPHIKEISNCITARENRGISNQQSVGNGVIVAMRGRNPDNPSDRTAGSPTEQRLEPNSQGICNTLTSVQKDNLVMETIIQSPRGYNKGNQHKICPPITSHSFQENNFLQYRYGIRKLTPKECWRLMGFSDTDFQKAENVNGNSQLYKQAGNSIVKNVLIMIFQQMLPRKAST